MASREPIEGYLFFWIVFDFVFECLRISFESQIDGLLSRVFVFGNIITTSAIAAVTVLLGRETFAISVVEVIPS